MEEAYLSSGRQVPTGLQADINRTFAQQRRLQNLAKQKDAHDQALFAVKQSEASRLKQEVRAELGLAAAP